MAKRKKQFNLVISSKKWDAASPQIRENACAALSALLGWDEDQADAFLEGHQSPRLGPSRVRSLKPGWQPERKGASKTAEPEQTST